ncbi:hypothetical protein Snas_0415 [Stackebrandtia nassauensis DSM 44728]|uniref:Uncharacterized protein n=1 Tax=Stackebrandtia nassauensis (strain DSM 44728 / CIP 108903 / NRRL B-16338 / NBRC 102104 / LLR-40K-21) TaxID=446470 RepID=D3Q4H2_STANL|nr:hypothetical protein Snas_0415 [Stackebrandtia nassauensis DSM 44728]
MGKLLALVIGGVCLLVVVAVIVGIVLLVSKAKRK